MHYMSMTTSPGAPPSGGGTSFHIFGKARLISLLALLALLILCVVVLWTTRGAMAHLPFLNRQRGAPAFARGKQPLVDISPWQTAQALAPLAVTAEETEYAREAERLADHEVDQAFAAALRQASLDAQHRTYTGKALVLSQKLAQLEEFVKEDQARVQSLTPKSGSPAGSGKKDAAPPAGNDDLDVAKAQLGLDSDELEDAQRDLDRASGDLSAQIQAELSAHEASMREYDSQVQNGGQIAVISEKRHATMAGRLKAWFSQRTRYQLLQQAQTQAQADVTALTAQHNSLEAKAGSSEAVSTANATDRTARLADIKTRRAEGQILSIYDDRIQTEQQLATVYGKWSAQVLLQHRIVFHLVLQSLALIIFILIAMLLFDALLRRLMAHPALDRRRTHTLHSILEVGIQVVGVVLILLVVFGAPQQTPTILGLTTAALTIALQDFILAFLGWFILVGKNGIHVGDWVEINGVGGEVTEAGLFSTTLLETGTLTDKGLPTGRRTSFMNGFAIRGQYFNFSTTGQWMWDEITVSVPAMDDIQGLVERIHAAAVEETKGNVRLAEQEWRRAMPKNSLGQFSADPVVNLRPSASGIDVQVRYVTRASERYDARNRMYRNLVDLMRAPNKPSQEQEIQEVGKA